MRLSGIHPGDIVRVNKRGRRFLATVISKHYRELGIMPTDNRITYRWATSLEVVDHWRKSRRRGREE